jgi:translation initiation factor 2 subunit 2
MTEYVVCQGCKGHESTLTKENRLFFVKCDTCGASRSVAAVSKGFQAQIGRRKDKVKA